MQGFRLRMKAPDFKDVISPSSSVLQVFELSNNTLLTSFDFNHSFVSK
jgi:hypothetical protein